MEKKPVIHHCQVASLGGRSISTIYLNQLNMYLHVSTKNTQKLCRQAWVPNFVLVGSKKLSAALCLGVGVVWLRDVLDDGLMEADGLKFKQSLLRAVQGK